MKSRIASVALAAIIAAGLIAPVAGEPPGQDLHLDILLTDGSRVLGRAREVKLALATAFGDVELALADGDRIDSNDDQETVTVRTGRGDLLKGVFLAPRETTLMRTEDGMPVRGRDLEQTIGVRPYGADGPRRVSVSEVRSLRAMDPIRIRGCEGATWEIGYENATGWTSENRDGALTVKRIGAGTVHSGSGGEWSTIRLRRLLAPRDDIELSAEISWDDEGAGPRAMQNLFLSLVDAEGDLIAAVGHNDSWVGETGSRYSQLAGVNRTKSSGYDSQPTCGRAKLEIERRDGEITILWGGVPIQCGTSRKQAARIEVAFEFYDYRNAGRNSAFGSVTLHRLQLR